MPVVYAFGSNGSGQLGVGHTDDLSMPRRCVFCPGKRRSGSGSGSGITNIESGSGDGDGDGDGDGRIRVQGQGQGQGQGQVQVRVGTPDNLHNDGVDRNSRQKVEERDSSPGNAHGGECGAGADDTPSNQFITGQDDAADADSAVVEVRKIVAGGNHTLLLTDDGRLFSAGKFTGGFDEEKTTTCVFVQRDLGPGIQGNRLNFSRSRGGPSSALSAFNPSISMRPQVTGRTTSDGKITDIAATWDASFIVIDRKTIFVCGSGSKGELGLGDTVTVAETLTKVFDVADFAIDHDTAARDTSNDQHDGGSVKDANDNDGNLPIRILAITACMAHVVVLLSNGHVYGWGNCRKGQLGQQVKDQKVLWAPMRIDRDSDGNRHLPWKPTSVVAGREYTVFLRKGEKPLFWGDTKFFDGDFEVLDRPLEDAAQLVSAWSSIHLYSPRQGSVHSMGRNHRGQLAPQGLPAIQVLAAGSEHCIALTRDNQVIAWGWGEHGNCGGDVDEKGNVAGRWNVISTAPADGKELIVKKVAAGCATSFVIYGSENG